jgi:hypothetical protein
VLPEGGELTEHVEQVGGKKKKRHFPAVLSPQTLEMNILLAAVSRSKFDNNNNSVDQQTAPFCMSASKERITFSVL